MYISLLCFSCFFPLIFFFSVSFLFLSSFCFHGRGSCLAHPFQGVWRTRPRGGCETDSGGLLLEGVGLGLGGGKKGATSILQSQSCSASILPLTVCTKPGPLREWARASWEHWTIKTLHVWLTLSCPCQSSNLCLETGMNAVFFKTVRDQVVY